MVTRNGPDVAKKEKVLYPQPGIEKGLLDFSTRSLANILTTSAKLPHLIGNSFHTERSVSGMPQYRVFCVKLSRQDMQCTYSNKSEAPSCSYCCSSKAVL